MVELSSSSDKKYKVAIIGASGAIGREVVEILSKDIRFSEVLIICRRTLNEWD